MQLELINVFCKGKYPNFVSTTYYIVSNTSTANGSNFRLKKCTFICSTVVQPSSRLPRSSSSFSYVTSSFLFAAIHLGKESGFGFSSVKLFSKFSYWLRGVKCGLASVAMRRGSRFVAWTSVWSFLAFVCAAAR